MASRSSRDPWALARSLAATLGCCAAALACSPRATFAAPSPPRPVALDSTVRFLQDVQNSDGGFGGESGSPSDPDFSAWVALALAGAGINPRDQARPGGVDAFTYLAEHAGELRETTDFERVLLVVDAAETSPRDFGGVDLVERILARELPDGSFAHEAGASTGGVNDTIFAILSLSPLHEATVQRALQRAATWLEEEQNPDGSWPAICPRTAVASCAEDGPERGEVDMTGAAVEALNAAGRHHGGPQRKAFEYLRQAQDADGGFPEYPGESEANVASSAWAVQAIWSAGQNPEEWKRSAGAEPLAYMESMQHEDGSIQWKASSDANPVWMTAYVAPALAGQALPIPGVALAAPSAPTSSSGESSTPPSPGSAEAGQGGESSRSGSGVIAGGGGHGAAPFSRPKPQSKGATPGGVRLLSTTHGQHVRAHHREPDLHRSTESVTSTTTAPQAPRPNGRRRGSGSASARNGAGAAASGGGAASSASALGSSGVRRDGAQVKGVLIAAHAITPGADVVEPGAPGFHSAGAGGSETPWLAIAIAVTIALAILAGSLLERRRPQVIL